MLLLHEERVALFLKAFSSVPGNCWPRFALRSTKKGSGGLDNTCLLADILTVVKLSKQFLFCIKNITAEVV